MCSLETESEMHIQSGDLLFLRKAWSWNPAMSLVFPQTTVSCTRFLKIRFKEMPDVIKYRYWGLSTCSKHGASCEGSLTHANHSL